MIKDCYEAPAVETAAAADEAPVVEAESAEEAPAAEPEKKEE